jgi:hypothetical protein
LILILFTLDDCSSFSSKNEPGQLGFPQKSSALDSLHDPGSISEIMGVSEFAVNSEELYNKLWTIKALRNSVMIYEHFGQLVHNFGGSYRNYLEMQKTISEAAFGCIAVSVERSPDSPEIQQYAFEYQGNADA